MATWHDQCIASVRNKDSMDTLDSKAWCPLDEVMEQVNARLTSFEQQLTDNLAQLKQAVNEKASQQQVEELKLQMGEIRSDMHQKAGAQELDSVQQEVKQKANHQKYIEIQKQVAALCDELIEQASHVWGACEAADLMASKFAVLQAEVAKLEESPSWIDLSVDNAAEFSLQDEYRVCLTSCYAVLYPIEVHNEYLVVGTGLPHAKTARVNLDNKSLLVNDHCEDLECYVCKLGSGIAFNLPQSVTIQVKPRRRSDGSQGCFIIE